MLLAFSLSKDGCKRFLLPNKVRNESCDANCSTKIRPHKCCLRKVFKYNFQNQGSDSSI